MEVRWCIIVLRVVFGIFLWNSRIIFPKRAVLLISFGFNIWQINLRNDRWKGCVWLGTFHFFWAQNVREVVWVVVDVVVWLVGWGWVYRWSLWSVSLDKALLIIIFNRIPQLILFMLISDQFFLASDSVQYLA